MFMFCNSKSTTSDDRSKFDKLKIEGFVVVPVVWLMPS